MTEETDQSHDYDGRSVTIDTGFYHVTVQGDPNDSLANVLEAAQVAADRAKADVESLDDRLDGDGRSFT